MKKIITALLLCTLFITGCDKAKEELVVDRPVSLVELDLDSLKEKLDSNTDFIVYIGRPNCGDCQRFKPLLDSYLERNSGTGIYYINIQKYNDEAKKDGATQEAIDFYANIRTELNFSWVPTIHRIVDGEFISSYEFARIADTTQDFETFTTWFEKELNTSH